MGKVEIGLEERKKIMVGILLCFHTFCEEKHLRYSLFYGTALGAVRHKGFIPWDDDIDVIMPYEDYIQFVSVFDSKDYLLHCIERKTKHYFYPFAKLVKKNTYSKNDLIANDNVGVYIDIFPFFNISKKIFLSNFDDYFSIIKEIFNIFYPKKVWVPPRSHYHEKHLKFILLRQIKFYMASKFSRFLIKKSYSSEPYLKMISALKTFSGNDFYIDGVPGAYANDDYFFPIDIFDNLENILFEGKYFKITSKYDICLTIRYGDYMKIPPLNDRINHSRYHFYLKK